MSAVTVVISEGRFGNTVITADSPEQALRCVCDHWHPHQGVAASITCNGEDSKLVFIAAGQAGLLLDELSPEHYEQVLRAEVESILTVCPADVHDAFDAERLRAVALDRATQMNYLQALCWFDDSDAAVARERYQRCDRPDEQLMLAVAEAVFDDVEPMRFWESAEANDPDRQLMVLRSLPAVEVLYENAQGERRARVLNPLATQGRTLRAYDHLSREVRSFRADRVISYRPVDAQTYAAPALATA